MLSYQTAACVGEEERTMPLETDILGLSPNYHLLHSLGELLMSLTCMRDTNTTLVGVIIITMGDYIT